MSASYRRPGGGAASVVRVIGTVAIAIIAAYFLVSFQYNPFEQDAAQYQLNMQSGLYDATREQGKARIFAATARWLARTLYVEDPFFLMGVLICASYIFRAINLRMSPLKWMIFIVMMLMPPIYMNYTQVFRQGVAGALVLNGLTLSSSWFAFAPLLGVGALIHQTFAPFSAVILLKELFARSKRPHLRAYAPLVDRAMFIGLPMATMVLYMFGDAILGEGRAGLYFSAAESNLKKITVSIMLLVCAWLLYDKRGSRLTSFTVYLIIFVAFAIPFSFDFLRLQTFVMPFVLMACLEARTWQRVTVVGMISLAISIYVTPSFGISSIL